MGDCDICSGDQKMPFTCNECGGGFCSQHRLPEEHNCPALRQKSDDKWFKEGLSVRADNETKRTGREEGTNEDQEQPPIEAEEDSGSEPVVNTAEDEEKDTCPDCRRDAIIECDDCGVVYCDYHYPPRHHDCTSTSSEDHDGVDGNAQGEPSGVMDSESGDAVEESGQSSGLTSCPECHRNAVGNCASCGEAFCTRHSEPRNHDCIQNYTGVLARIPARPRALRVRNKHPFELLLLGLTALAIILTAI